MLRTDEPWLGIRMTSASSDTLDEPAEGSRFLPPAGSRQPVKVIILANPYSGAKKNREHVAELAWRWRPKVCGRSRCGNLTNWRRSAASPISAANIAAW